jgi:hypothetical protein
MDETQFEKALKRVEDEGLLDPEAAVARFNSSF